MLAFHGKQEVKDKYLFRVHEHQRLDELAKGVYFEDGAPGKRRMCAVGCTIHGSDHSAYERELGIPRLIARLEDGIFEGLPMDLAKTWPSRFLEAIAPGADLSNVWPEFAVWMLTDSAYGVLQFAKTDKTRKAIQDVADLYTMKLQGAIIPVEDWQKIRTAAYAAAAADADDAAYAAYAAAADAAAYAAAAADAADAAAYAAAAADAAADAAAAAAARKIKREEWRVGQSDKLLELLKACEGKK